MYELAQLLFPIARSLTGKGIRESFNIISEIHPEFKTISFYTGEKVGDWQIPEEWVINDAYIELENGTRICEFNKCNLYIVGYSIPINVLISFQELKQHLHYREDLPDAIPYVTSYYGRNWGFCLSYEQYKKLKQQEKYKCVIDSELKSGQLDLIEAKVPSTTKSNKDIFFSSYLCHPSMANNELSGPVLIAEITKYIKSFKSRKYNYRFVLLPETIGSIAYLSKNLEELKDKVICGFNLSCCGDNLRYTHLKSPYGNNIADMALSSALINKDSVYTKSFLERGSDERQYCSPKVNLPICGFSRSKYGDYPEYHTSLDNLDFISQKGLEGSFEVIKSIIDAFELGLYPKIKCIGEPQLGKRGLYSNLSKCNYKTERDSISMRMDIIAYCNGTTSAFEIALITSIELSIVVEELKLLSQHNLIELRDEIELN
tara:strand:- start:8156 stop:9448 length:1293 start_codon:yes stop_codon:yes gene_type:complete